MDRLSGILLGALLCGCGIKAPPRPPGVPAAVRGEEGTPCDGCQIPGPDAYPAPSTPSPSPVTTPVSPRPPDLEGPPPGLPGTPEIPKAPEEGAPTTDPEPPAGPAPDAKPGDAG